MADLTSDDAQALGPVDYIVVEFPDGTPTSGGFQHLLDLARRGVIGILDLEFLRRDTNGVHAIPIADVPSTPGLDLSVWDGASSGLTAARNRGAE